MSISINMTATHTNCRPKPRSFWARLHAAFSAKRQRRQLHDLDDHILNDIGITRAEAIAESHEPVWNVPNHWCK